MSEKVRVSRVAIKTEVIEGHGESNGVAYRVTVGRLNDREKERLIDALSKVGASSWMGVERPEGASGVGISFEMYSKLKNIAQPVWVCNDAILEFETEGFCQNRLDLVHLDDFSEDSPMTPWFKTDTAEDDDDEEELEHVTEEFADVGIEILDLEFAGGNPRCNYWAKIRLFDLTPSEVEKVKRVYERDPEDLPKRTRCRERLEPGFELEVRPSKEHPGPLKEVTVVLYCKDYAPFKTVGAYARDVNITLDNCESATCPVLDVTRVYSSGIKILEPEKRFGYVNPVEDAVNKEYFFADILCQKIGGKEMAYTINARSDKTKVIFLSTAAEFNERDSGLGNLISEAREELRIYTYDNCTRAGDYTHATFVPFVQDCIEVAAEMELPCRAIFESSDQPKLVGMVFICPSYAEHNADNLPTVQLLDETLIKMCIRDGHLKEEDQVQLYKDIEKRGLNEEEETTMPAEEFTLLSVAVKTREVVRAHSGMHICKIHIGRMSESEKTELESFVRGISAYHGPHRSPINMVEGGKTVPGTREPLHTYETYVSMAALPSPVVDVCDLKFTYVAEKDIILAEVIERDALFEPGIRGVNWFNVHPVDWDQCEKEEKEEEREMSTPDGHYFMHVALNVERSIGGHWYVVRIGRLSDCERTSLKRLSKNLNPSCIPPCGDPTEGKVIFSSEQKECFSEATVCVRSVAWLEAGATYDCCNFLLETGGSRLELNTFSADANSDAIRCRNWFGTETENVFEARGVVICNHGSSGMQIARLDAAEQTRFDSFAGEYGSALNGRFNRLLTGRSIFNGNDRVLKNVSFADGIEFRPGDSICMDYIKIERTGNKFKVVEATRCDEENVEERWHLASTETPEDRRVTFSNVAVKVTKKVGSLDYYILEIGRLAADELDSLKKVYRHVGDYNTETHEMDETKAKVLSREICVVDGDGETWTYYVAKVCVYWPRRPKDMIGKAIDSAEITLESHHGNFRPTLENIERHEEIHNQYSGRWFERFPFEEKDDEPIKIRLNNVVAETVTHAREYGGERLTIEFSLARCCNYQQATDDISKALAIREGETVRGISWNPHTKILEVNIQNENSDDVSRIADAHAHPWMLTLQYNPDNGAWGIDMMHEILGYGGFVYANPARRSGKTVAIQRELKKRMLNSAYGMCIPEGADFDGDVLAYCRADVITQESMWRRAKKFEEETMKARMPEITNIEFRDPATIVFWSDGTKTVVRCQNGEKYDPEKGMAMAICRKVYGNERDYYHLFLHWMKKARKNEAQKKTPAKKPATAPKKKGGSKK